MTDFFDAGFVGVVPSDPAHLLNALRGLVLQAARATVQRRVLREASSIPLSEMESKITAALTPLQNELARRSDFAHRADNLRKLAREKAALADLDPCEVSKLRGEAASLEEWLKDNGGLKVPTAQLEAVLRDVDEQLTRVTRKHCVRFAEPWAAEFVNRVAPSDTLQNAHELLCISTRILATIAALRKGELPNKAAAVEVPPIKNLPVLR